jgi:membrane fusion protein (multidrug efflux system)
MNTRLRTLMTLPALVLTLIACHPGGDEDVETAAASREAALAPREVRLITAEVREERPTLELVGEVRAFDSIAVSPEVAGRVDAVNAEVGDRVRRDQPLAEVDRATYKIYLQQAEAELAAARADLDLASKGLDRKRDLLADETIAQATFDQAKAGYDLAAARVSAAEATRSLAQRNWERSVVRAPAGGSITERMVVAGQWTDVGQTIFRLAVGDTVKVAARVPASWAPRLSGLDGFDFSVGASDQVRRARLYSIDPVVNESSRSFEVVGVVSNTDGALRPGMFANVSLVAPAAARSLWLPVSAVATSDMSQVMVVQDGTIVVQRVQVGRRVDRAIEIVDGLDAAQPVVADVAGLNRGVPVTVVE